MKIIKLYSLLTVSIFCTNLVNAQTEFQKKLESYKNFKKVEILKKIQITKNCNYLSDPKLTMIVIPFCYYNCKAEQIITDNNGKFLEIDTSKIIALFIKNSAFFGRIYYDNDILPNVQLISISGIKNNTNRKKYIDKFMYAYKHSENIFSPSIETINKINYIFELGFIKDNKTKFIYEDSSINTINEFIEIKFGSTKKFIEDRSFNDRKNEIFDSLSKSADSINLLKNILKNDYSIWLYMYPKDSTKGLNLFLHEADSLANMTIYQERLLRKKINTEIKNCHNYNHAYPEIPYYNKNIYSIVKSVLPLDQYVKYETGRRMNDFLTFKSRQFLIEHYKREIKIPDNIITDIDKYNYIYNITFNKIFEEK